MFNICSLCDGDLTNDIVSDFPIIDRWECTQCGAVKEMERDLTFCLEYGIINSWISEVYLHRQIILRKTIAPYLSDSLRFLNSIVIVFLSFYGRINGSVERN